MSVLPGYTAWFELGMVLTIATALMTALLLLLERMTKSAARRRLLWQAGTVCILLLLLVEATGFGPMAGAWLRGRRAQVSALDGGLHDGSSEAIASQTISVASVSSDEPGISRVAVESTGVAVPPPAGPWVEWPDPMVGSSLGIVAEGKPSFNRWANGPRGLAQPHPQADIRLGVRRTTSTNTNAVSILVAYKSPEWLSPRNGSTMNHSGKEPFQLEQFSGGLSPTAGRSGSLADAPLPAPVRPATAAPDRIRGPIGPRRHPG